MNADTQATTPQTETDPLPTELPLLAEHQLRHADSLKWQQHGGEVLPLWIADMDFPPSPAIARALTKRLERTVGYPAVGLEGRPLRRLVAEMVRGRGLEVSEANIRFLPSVVPGLYAAVAGLTGVGDGVLSVTPIYPPFHQAVTKQGREWQGVPLRQLEGGGGSYAVDWEAMEQAVTPRTRLLLWCHPHNPTGRVWTAEELGTLADFVERHDLLVCSDELHADLAYAGAPHVTALAAHPKLRERTLTLVGPGKSYNIAALGSGAMLAANAALLERVDAATSGLMGQPSGLSLLAWQTALEEAQDWLAAVKKQLAANRETVTQWAAQQPHLSFQPPQATYVAWLDYRQHPHAAELHGRVLAGGVALTDGRAFAPTEASYAGCLRLNFATTPDILARALGRVAAVTQE